mgnify:CR=1 FL=1
MVRSLVVLAPLGPRQIVGIVWEAGRLPGNDVPDSKLRPLLAVLPVPPLAKPLRRLIEWTADYYCAPLSAVARMTLSSGAALRGGGLTYHRAVLEVAGETLEGAYIIRQMAQVLPIWEREGAITPRALPLMRMLCRIITEDAPVSIPFEVLF